MKKLTNTIRYELTKPLEPGKFLLFGMIIAPVFITLTALFVYWLTTLPFLWANVGGGLFVGAIFIISIVDCIRN